MLNVSLILAMMLTSTSAASGALVVTNPSCDRYELAVAPGPGSLVAARDLIRSARQQCSDDAGVAEVTGGNNGNEYNRTGFGSNHKGVRTPNDVQFYVRLLPGVHRLTAPLRLDAADSGTRWHGEPGAVVSGGVAITGWRLYTPSPITIPSGDHNFTSF